MNVIVHWKAGGYADVYQVDELKTSDAADLRMFRNIEGKDVEVARFDKSEVRGWQVFLTIDDASNEN